MCIYTYVYISLHIIHYVYISYIYILFEHIIHCKYVIYEMPLHQSIYRYLYMYVYIYIYIYIYILYIIHSYILVCCECTNLADSPLTLAVAPKPFSLWA